MADETNDGNRADLPVDFDDFLNFDPLVAAEELTGKSYKDDEATAKLGMALHMMYAKAKREELGLRNDSYYGMSYADFIVLVEDLGFELVFEELFSPGVEQSWMEPDIVDSFRIYWREGLLLTCESYRGESLNSSTVYFNGEFPEARLAWQVSGLSGHLHRELYDEGTYVWVGSFDGREGLRHTIGQLEDLGSVLPQWVEQPFLWLLNYAEKGGSADYEFVSSMKLSELPPHVREAIPSGEVSG